MNHRATADMAVNADRRELRQQGRYVAAFEQLEQILGSEHEYMPLALPATAPATFGNE